MNSKSRFPNSFEWNGKARFGLNFSSNPKWLLYVVKFVNEICINPNSARLITFQSVIKADHLLFQADQCLLCFGYTLLHTTGTRSLFTRWGKTYIGLVSCLGNSLPSHQFFNSEEGNGFMSLGGKTGGKKVKT